MHVITLEYDEVKDKFKETYGDEWFWAFTNADTENNKALCDYTEYDEFYTDGVHYIATDEVDDIITGLDAWMWAVENDDFEPIYDYFYGDYQKALRCGVGFELTTDEVMKGYEKIATENADSFLAWKWGKENDLS